MGEIIECDFRRTARRTRIGEINAIFNKIMQDFYIEGKNEISLSDETFNALQNEYVELLKEENYWKDCKYWK